MSRVAPLVLVLSLTPAGAVADTFSGGPEIVAIQIIVENILPETNPLPAGFGASLTAIGTDGDENTFDLTDIVDWDSSDTDILTVDDGSLNPGAIVGISPGQVIVTATHPDNAVFDTLTVEVSDAALEFVHLLPPSSSTPVGLSTQILAFGQFADGTQTDVREFVNWTSGDDQIAIVSNNPGSQGNATAISEGTTTITATHLSTGIFGEKLFTSLPPVPFTITVTPADTTEFTEFDVPYTATGSMTDGSEAIVTADVTWTSSDSLVATISNAVGTEGVASTGIPGQTTVTATAPTAMGSTTLTVVPRPDWYDGTVAPLEDPLSGRGVAWNDSDGDGDPDLLVINSDAPSHLFRNDDGDFVDVIVGFPGAAPSSAGVFGDMDNDGDLDVYVTERNSANHLFRNDGANAFVDMTAGPLGNTGNSRSAAWADYDLDGDLDLYVANNGQSNILLRNDAGTFVDASDGPLGDAGSGRGVAWGDYDNDGRPDLYIANTDGGANVLLRNTTTGFALATTGDLGDTGDGRGVTWIDIDEDGNLDIYLTNDGSPNRLFLGNGFGSFVEATPQGLAHAGASRSAAWADFDDDGDLDVYLPDAGGENRMMRNDGAGGFNQVETVGADIGTSTGAAWADYDGDGDVDLYVVNDGLNRLLRNDVYGDSLWLNVDLIGTVSNRFGVGARLELTAGGATQHRQVSAGEGYLSQSALTVHFGTGDDALESLRIFWPSGAITDTVPATNQRIVLVEPLPSLVLSESFEMEVPVGALATAALGVGNAPGSPPLTWTVADDGTCAFFSVIGAAGVTPGGEVSDVGLHVDATALGAGTYSCAVVLQTDDPTSPEVTVPVTVTVREPFLAPPIDVVLGTQRTAIGTRLLAFAPDGTLTPVGGTGLSFDLKGLTVGRLGEVWATSGVNDHLYRLDGRTGASIDLGSLGTGAPLEALAVDAAGDLWGLANTLYQVDPDAVNAEPVGGNPLASGLAYDPVADRLLGVLPVTDNSAFLTEIDRATGTGTILTATNERVIDLAVTSGGDAFANGLGRFYTLDLTTGNAESLEAFDSGEFLFGLGIWPAAIAISVDPTESSTPARVSLPRPNPFRSRTTIGFSLSEAGRVRVEVFDAQGRQVDLLLDEVRAVGSYEVPFDGSRLASGVYYTRVRMPGMEKTRKVAIVR